MPRLPIHLDEAEVLEGFGTAPSTLVPPPRNVPMTTNLILQQTEGPSPRVYERRTPFDRADALRQLRLALGVDVPPQLRPVPAAIRVTGEENGAACVPPACTPVVLNVAKRVVSSSPEMVLNQVQTLLEECEAVKRWLGMTGAPASATTRPAATALPGAPETSLAVRRALCASDNVQVLLARVKGLERAQRCWPTTCDEFHALLEKDMKRLGGTASPPAVSVTAADALGHTRDAVHALHRIETQLWRLAPLLQRYRRLEPALSEAAQKQEGFACVAELTSQECLAGLQSVVSEAERLSGEMALGVKQMHANRTAVRARAAALGRPFDEGEL